MSLAILTAAVRGLTDEANALADTAGRLQAAPVTVQIRVESAPSDRTRATAVRRQQTPEEISALRKALGL